MTVVLDTNVLSELMRPEPARQVVHWVSRQSADDLLTTSVTKAEILFGIRRLPVGQRRNSLVEVARAMFDEDFGGKLLAFDSFAAEVYADIAASRERSGRPISSYDAQIAAIALSVGSTVATRNTADFEGCGVKLVNPWEERLT